MPVHDLHILSRLTQNIYFPPSTTLTANIESLAVNRRYIPKRFSHLVRLVVMRSVAKQRVWCHLLTSRVLGEALNFLVSRYKGHPTHAGGRQQPGSARKRSRTSETGILQRIPYNTLGGTEPNTAKRRRVAFDLEEFVAQTLSNRQIFHQQGNILYAKEVRTPCEPAETICTPIYPGCLLPFKNTILKAAK